MNLSFMKVIDMLKVNEKSDDYFEDVLKGKIVLSATKFLFKRIF